MSAHKAGGTAKKVLNGIADPGLPRRSYDYRVRGLGLFRSDAPASGPDFGEPVTVAGGAHEWRTSHSLHVSQARAACTIALCVPLLPIPPCVLRRPHRRSGTCQAARPIGRSARASKCCASDFSVPKWPLCRLTIESRPVRPTERLQTFATLLSYAISAY